MHTSSLFLIINLYVFANIGIANCALLKITCMSTSMCEDVVIENVDKYNCWTDIDEQIKKHNISSYSVRFYVKEKYIDIQDKDIVHDCEVTLHDGCSIDDNLCICKGDYNIYWNLTATYRDRDSQIQARLFKDKKNIIYSNILPGPRIIKDPRNPTFQLRVNNKEVQDNGEIIISKDDEELLFKIEPQESAEVLSLHYVVNNLIFKSGQKIRVKPGNITIKIKLCDRELRSYNLSLLYDDPKPTASKFPESSTKTSKDADKSSNCSLDVWIGLVAVLSFIIFGLLILLINVTPEVIVIYLVGRNIYVDLRRKHRQLFQEYQKIFALKVAQENLLPKFTHDNYHVEYLNKVYEKENNELNVRNYILFLTKWNLEMENCKGIMQRKQELENRKTDIIKCNLDFTKRIQHIGNSLHKLPNCFPSFNSAQWRKDLVKSLKEIEDSIEVHDIWSNQSEDENPNSDYEKWIDYLESRNKDLKEDNSKLRTSNILLEDIIKQLANETGDSKSEQSPLITDSQSHYPI